VPMPDRCADTVSPRRRARLKQHVRRYDEGVPQTTSEIDLRRVLRTLRRRRLLSALVALGMAAVALVVSTLSTAMYRASAEIVVQPDSAQSVFDQAGSASAPTGSVETEIRVVQSDPVRRAATEELGGPARVSATRVGETEIMRITALEPSPRRAADVANAFAKAYVDLRKSQAIGDVNAASEQIRAKINSLQVEIDALDRRLSQASAQERAAVEASVGPRYTSLITEQGLLSQKLNSLEVDAALKTGGVQLVRQAEVPTEQASPNPVRNGIAALVVGLILGVGLAFLRDHLDDSVATKDDLVAAAPQTPVLGVVPVLKEWTVARATASHRSPDDASVAAVEAYRTLRTSIQLLGVDRPLRTLQVTSPGAGEGKTTVLANLGLALSAGGQRTVLVDCDLRRPRLHELFGLPNDVGMSTVLAGDISPLDVVRQVPGGGSLFVVTAGPIPNNPVELLLSKRASKVMFELEGEFETVLVDSPPVLAVTDAVVLAAWVDATLLVARARRTGRRAVDEALERLGQVNARIAGTILNGAAAADSYGYGYGYAQEVPRSRGRSRPKPDTRADA
jgi:polysaccharide biosynthesis transport protein